MNLSQKNDPRLWPQKMLGFWILNVSKSEIKRELILQNFTLYINRLQGKYIQCWNWDVFFWNFAIAVLLASNSKNVNICKTTKTFISFNTAYIVIYWYDWRFFEGSVYTFINVFKTSQLCNDLVVYMCTNTAFNDLPRSIETAWKNSRVEFQSRIPESIWDR